MPLALPNEASAAANSNKSEKRTWTMGGLAKILGAFLLACLVPYLSFKMGARSALNNTSLTAAAGSAVNRDKYESRIRAKQAPPLNTTRPSIEEELPSCAKDVFISLHKELGGDDEGTCMGLLISDDILITSRECSESKFTFDFPGFGLAEAVPHALLNLNAKDEMEDTRLGFLKATPPRRSRFMGRHFMGLPVRRALMFLGDRESGALATPTLIECIDDRIPVARNFPVDGELVSLGPLAGVVPDNILWEEADLETAVELTWKNNRWWTRPIDLEGEKEEIREMIDMYRGPPGSLSVPDAHSYFVSMAGGLFEAVDPRGHRRGDCFKNYLIRYMTEQPFSGMHFFDWLDFGHGKYVLREKKTTRNVFPKDLNCLREKWNYKTVHYFNDEERREHEVYIEPSGDGRELVARYRHNDAPVPESDPDDPHLYMWDLNGTFYVVDDTWDEDRYGEIKHTAVLAGRPALSAGKAYFGKGGAVWGINFSSGHYRPGLQAVAMMYQWMKNRGFNTTALHWVGREHWLDVSCDDIDWNSIEIPGYDCEELRQACHEAKASPTWVTYDDV